MSTTAAQMLNRFSTFFVADVASGIMQKNKKELADINRRQLHKGQSAKGGFLQPLMINDPWFKTQEAARSYIAWKKKITPDTPEGVANLFINGYTHSRLEAIVSRDKYGFKFAGLPWGKEVDTKYDGQQLGLNDESKQEAWKNIIRSPFVHKIAEITKCRIKR